MTELTNVVYKPLTIFDNLWQSSLTSKREISTPFLERVKGKLWVLLTSQPLLCTDLEKIFMEDTSRHSSMKASVGTILM